MADGNGPKAGYDIIVDGIWRTFRDGKSAAIEAAIFLKSKGKADLVMIHDRETGRETMVLPDGRLA